MNNQFDKRNAYFLPLPDEAYGAFRHSLVDGRLRLPAQVHAIVALCGAFDLQTDVMAAKKKAEKESGESKKPKIKMN
ncbi:MAG: hypothetical protein M5R36_27265 [Deltaproteobacteria bacterium]|nr:hypothetical protein [Deltaproteobacteria bacterium]